MSEANKYSPAVIIEHLVNCINRGDKGAFYQWVERYAGGLSTSGELHGRIRRVLAARPQEMQLLDTLNQSLKELVSHREPIAENVYLNPETAHFVQVLLTEWKHQDLYAYHNLGVRRKLLLYGPTGNGKTTLARYLARQVGLPLVQVNVEQIVASLVGHVGRNIARVFTLVKEPCVLFLDEIDSLGRRRGTGEQEGGATVEHERAVNALLVHLEGLASDVIFIGATNRREALDAALLRRFDAHFEMQAPSPEEKAAYAQQLLDFHRLPAELRPADLTAQASLSDVRLHVVDAARERIVRQVLAAQAQP